MLLASRERAVAFPDAYPVSPGHCLVIPRRHEPDFFKLTREEQEDIWDIVWELRELLEAEHDTTSYNVGINAGEAAGQTVPHAHVHVIPRYPGRRSGPARRCALGAAGQGSLLGGIAPRHAPGDRQTRC